MKIYVASSWRNQFQQDVVGVLRVDGNEVYDFRNPDENDKGFSWSDIDPDWQAWTVEQYRKGLDHIIAQNGYLKDYKAMQWADLCVLVLTCGRSAHLEAGWFVGCGKPLIILIPAMEPIEPELMYNMATSVVDNYADMLAAVQACCMKNTTE